MNKLFQNRTALKLVSALTVGTGAFVALNNNNSNSNSKLYQSKSTTPTAVQNQNIFHAEEKTVPSSLLNTVQPTVYTGNHAQCVVATIYLRYDDKVLRHVLEKSAELDSIVQKVAASTGGANDDEEEEDEYSLPPVMASIGFDTGLWSKIVNNTLITDTVQSPPLTLPRGIGPFEKRVGKYGSMPHANSDLVLHVKASTRSQCYEVVQQFIDTLPSDAIVRVEDRYGWQYRDGRDLSGFIDGTENPSTKDERIEASVIPETGGSFLIHQVWQHDLQSLRRVEQREQEEWIGRKKEWSEELSEKEMPITSHVRRMRDEQFKRVPIVRQSMPFGSVGGDSGLLFIAYANNVHKFDRLLDRMVGNTKDGHSDYVMKFSKCISSNYYYIPSRTELAHFKKNE